VAIEKVVHCPLHLKYIVASECFIANRLSVVSLKKKCVKRQCVGAVAVDRVLAEEILKKVLQCFVATEMQRPLSATYRLFYFYKQLFF